MHPLARAASGEQFSGGPSPRGARVGVLRPGVVGDGLPPPLRGLGGLDDFCLRAGAGCRVPGTGPGPGPWSWSWAWGLGLGLGLRLSLGLGLSLSLGLGLGLSLGLGLAWPGLAGFAYGSLSGWLAANNNGIRTCAEASGQSSRPSGPDQDRAEPSARDAGRRPSQPASAPPP